MSYSPESLIKAAKMTGLSSATHIHVDNLTALQVKTSRLAEFLERQKYLESIDLSDVPLPTLKPFNPPIG